MTSTFRPCCLLSILLFTVGCARDVLPTVGGPVDWRDAGVVLTHEHVMSNFGADPDRAGVYDEAALFAQVVPYLRELKGFGVDAVFDCTTQYFGRRVDLLRRLSDSSGVILVTNTGLYGAAADRYVPEDAYRKSAEALAADWIGEFEQGIDGTGIRPGFIKLAFDGGEPSDIDEKLFVAGLLTHRRTGLTLAVHTGDNRRAVERQLELLRAYRVGPEAWVWVHANKEEDTDFLLATAARGAWISLDGVNAGNTAEYVERLLRFREAGLLGKVLLSHDGNGYPRGGAIRPFGALMSDLLPALRSAGFSRREIERLTVDNPRRAFAPGTHPVPAP